MLTAMQELRDLNALSAGADVLGKRGEVGLSAKLDKVVDETLLSLMERAALDSAEVTLLDAFVCTATMTEAAARAGCSSVWFGKRLREVAAKIDAARGA